MASHKCLQVNKYVTSTKYRTFGSDQFLYKRWYSFQDVCLLYVIILVETFLTPAASERELKGENTDLNPLDNDWIISSTLQQGYVVLSMLTNYETCIRSISSPGWSSFQNMFMLYIVIRVEGLSHLPQVRENWWGDTDVSNTLGNDWVTATWPDLFWLIVSRKRRNSSAGVKRLSRASSTLSAYSCSQGFLQLLLTF